MTPRDPQECRKHVILVVDDDISVRNVARTVLETYGFSVLEAADGEAALEALKVHGASISLSVLDIIMPGKNGKEVFAEIRKLLPDARVLFMSGCGLNILSPRDIEQPGVGFLPKPSSAQELVDAVQALLDA